MRQTEAVAKQQGAIAAREEEEGAPLLLAPQGRAGPFPSGERGRALQAPQRALGVLAPARPAAAVSVWSVRAPQALAAWSSE